MSANTPSGNGPEYDPTVAYRWNQGQEPENPPTMPLQSGQQPYPPQQPAYGQPSQYGQPPQQGQAPQYGQSSQYGQQQPSHGQQQPYGQAPQYGAQQPQYGQQAPQYGQQAQYGQQQAPQFGQQAQYGQQAQFGQPSSGQESLQFGGPEPGKKGRKGWIVAIAAALAVVLLGGGAWAVVSATGLLGGGTQPHDVLPGNAIGYVRFDINPDAGQKAALLALSQKFTVTKGKLSGDDPRKSLFEAIQKDSEDLKGVNYAADVEPWLGDRLGIAVLPSGGEEPGVAVAVQVTDETAAKSGIAKLAGKDAKFGLAFRDGYAIITDTQANADKHATGPTLAENTNFSDDFAALNGDGILSFWADFGKLMDLAKAEIPAEQQPLVDQIKNARLVGALRFDSAFAELTGLIRGYNGGVEGDLVTADLSKLPASTAGAISVSGLDQMVTKFWSTYEKTITAADPTATQMIEQFKQQAGIQIPGDLATLLGKNLTVAVDSEGLDGEMPNVGLRLTTDPAKAQALLDKIQKLLTDSGQQVPQFGKVSGDGVFTVATTDAYAKKLNEEGTLGDNETFTTAIPDSGNATYAIFVDLDKIEKFYLGSLEGDDKANAAALRAVGISSAQNGDTTTFSLRVLFN
ncbi:DUF3352 domain-containing protein [Nonomuraea sp. NPDC050663]|uniref:DUF3352 domain-containing protein n=1 Tax=Nonomuraea sp. NPDC050663 TaxID=3364370 RepID=UPI00379226B4